MRPVPKPSAQGERTVQGSNGWAVKAPGTSCCQRAHRVPFQGRKRPLFGGEHGRSLRRPALIAAGSLSPQGYFTSNLCAASTTAPPTLLISRWKRHPVCVASNGDTPYPAVDGITSQRAIDTGHEAPGARPHHSKRSMTHHYSSLAMDLQLCRAYKRYPAVVDRAFGAKQICTSEEQRQRSSSPTARNLLKNLLKGAWDELIRRDERQGGGPACADSSRSKGPRW